MRPDWKLTGMNAEAQQKHAARIFSLRLLDRAIVNTNGTVDVDRAPSTSTEVPPSTRHLPKPDENQISRQEHGQDFLTYDSPLNWYPLLALRTQRVPLSSSSMPSTSSFSSFAHTSSSSSASSLAVSPPVALLPPATVSTITLPNLVPLKLATASKMLDPVKRLCQYEVPGPGVCRDEGCEDVHLSRITGLDGRGGVEPSDPDTAEYLLNALPRDWLTENQISGSRMSVALQRARVKNPQMAFEERVKEALTSLELPP
ncbi:hypothetical protein C0995_006577 [Termitomyces sp. Mi166|nr:hypothetical protein C0995_006577 [Termitomyces sp. Mi166\